MGKMLYENRLSIFILLLIGGLLGHHYLSFYDFDIKIQKKGTDLVAERPAPRDPSHITETSRQPPIRLTRSLDVKSWAYYIKDPQLASVRKAATDLVVIDTGSDTIPRFSRQQIEEAKGTGKKIIAYLSLGAAENYRDYWKPEWTAINPSWMAEQNILWKGNFRVENLLNEEWMKISKSLIDAAMNSGFDGVMINGIDAPDAIGFLREIHRYIKARDSRFIILVQDYLDPAAIDYLDGIVYQNIMYNYGLEAKSNHKSTIEKLRDFINRDRIVLAVSYTTGSRWEKVKNELKTNGIIPYSAPVRLDVLRTDQ